MTAVGARERDPHFRKILEGLAGPLDPHAFEECVQDVLRDAFPGLVGVHGGSDAGMDGAIADGEEEPYPLIATTSDRVVRNLTGSLESYLAHGGRRRNAVVATSAALTPQRRRNLEERARELGFTLLQIFERRDIASRLYRDSRWTEALLGITGEPPALSAFPKTRWPFLEIEPIGREEDLEWLRSSAGDRLVVGDPGSGKTLLLSQVVREGRALFLATEDDEELANAYREQLPEMVLVDDAHLDPARLDRLRQIRHDIHADFALVATSWKGDWQDVAAALGGLDEGEVRHLELLSRSEIIEVLRRVGVQEEDDSPYLAELVNQAANRPGLAVTLGNAWLRGNYREVLTGEALYRSLVPALRMVLEGDPRQLLAAFSVGGGRGMSVVAVADFLGSGVGDVWERASRVGASGVLSERGKDEAGEAVLAVNPETLRAALLHDVFFTGPGRAWEPLARRAESFASAIGTLVFASDRHVPVPREDLQRLLLEVGADRAWRIFAAMGEAEGAWALENYPGPTAGIAPQVLDTVPTQAIDRLLKEAEAWGDSGDPVAREPMEVLRRWIEEVPDPPQGLDELLRRRRQVVDVALARLRQGAKPEVALRAAFRALAPRLERTRGSAAGGALILRQGSLPGEAVPEMLRLWRRVREAMPRLERDMWRELDDALHWWIHPNLPRRERDEAQLEPFHRMARRILTDLVPLAEGRSGLASALLERAGEMGLDLDLEVDPVFKVLYPGWSDASSAEDHEFRHEALRDAEEAARELARAWAKRPPEAVVEDLARYAEEAGWGHGSLGTIAHFEMELAQEAEAPAEWLTVLLEKSARPSLVGQFLARVVQERRPGWQEILEGCLGSREHSWAASEQVLRLEGPPEDLLEQALLVMEPQVVEIACQQGRVPSATLRRLLTHPEARLRVAAAVGEWLSNPEGRGRPEVQREWRQALLASSVSDVERRSHERYWMRRIFLQDPELSLEWLQSQLPAGPDERPVLVMEQGIVPAAIGSLDREQRVRLLRELPARSFSTSLVYHLVDVSPDLYQELLNRQDLREHHLAPLAGKPPDDEWLRLARLALAAGHDPRDVATVSFHFRGVYSPSVQFYSQWEEAFRELAATEHRALREVARHGLAEAAELLEEARRRERRSQLTGQL